MWAVLLAEAEDDLALLLHHDEEASMDIVRVVHRDADGRIVKIVSHERDRYDALADLVRARVRAGDADAEGRLMIPVPAELSERLGREILGVVAERLAAGPAEGRPTALLLTRETSAPAARRIGF
jgi:hypothetical protein